MKKNSVGNICCIRATKQDNQLPSFKRDTPYIFQCIEFYLTCMALYPFISRVINAEHSYSNRSRELQNGTNPSMNIFKEQRSLRLFPLIFNSDKYSFRFGYRTVLNVFGFRIVPHELEGILSATRIISSSGLALFRSPWL